MFRSLFTAFQTAAEKTLKIHDWQTVSNGTVMSSRFNKNASKEACIWRIERCGITKQERAFITNGTEREDVEVSYIRQQLTDKKNIE